MPVVSLEQLLTGDTGNHLGKIVHIARKMDDLTEALRAALPPELAEHLVAAAIRGEQELVMVASSSAWAARLRYEGPGIMVTAREHGTDVSRCKVIVQTDPQL